MINVIIQNDYCHGGKSVYFPFIMHFMVSPVMDVTGFYKSGGAVLRMTVFCKFEV